VKKNLIFIILGLVLVTFASLRLANNNTVYYFTTTEALENIDLLNERVKLGGFVMQDSISKNETNTLFNITDGNTVISINFDGYVPELFQENMGVILDGVFVNNTFLADNMLVKHDNEYISDDGEVYDAKNYSK
jgi:cytochrome c-type biogenesis protein CcmE